MSNEPGSCVVCFLGAQDYTLMNAPILANDPKTSLASADDFGSAETPRIPENLRAALKSAADSSVVFCDE